MPFFLSLFSFLNGVSWTTYALIPLDAFVLVSITIIIVKILFSTYSIFSTKILISFFDKAPNSMGIALGLAQLLLYAMYYKSTKRQNAGRKAEEELDLTEQTGSSVTRKTSNSAGVQWEKHFSQWPLSSPCIQKCHFFLSISWSEY